MTTVSDLHKELEHSLKQLYLSSVKKCYREEADLARRESSSYEEYLRELMSRECEERHQRRIARYLRESKLPLEKSLDSFDQSRLPAKVKALVKVLLEGSFLQRCKMYWRSATPAAAKLICFALLPRN